jgi:hypothetical protein
MALHLAVQTVQAEPTAAECGRAIDAAEALAAQRPGNDPERLAAEHLLREARGEGGSGETEECLEYVASALRQLSLAVSTDSAPR